MIDSGPTRAQGWFWRFKRTGSCQEVSVLSPEGGVETTSVARMDDHLACTRFTSLMFINLVAAERQSCPNTSYLSADVFDRGWVAHVVQRKTKD